jgi:hypothetical protein
MSVKMEDCIEVYFPSEGNIRSVKWLRERGWKLWGVVDTGMLGLDLNSTVLRVFIPPVSE